MNNSSNYTEDNNSNLFSRTKDNKHSNLLNRIDYNDLREQIQLLIKLNDNTPEANERVKILGIISLLQAIQTNAVNHLGYSEEEVYGIDCS